MTTRTELNAGAADLLRLFNDEGTLVSYHCRVGDWVEADRATRDEEEKPSHVRAWDQQAIVTALLASPELRAAVLSELGATETLAQVSRLRAAETEVATYENAITQFDTWLSGQALWYKQTPQVNQTFLECAEKLMHTLRTVRVPNPRPAHALANPPGPRHAREVEAKELPAQIALTHTCTFASGSWDPLVGARCVACTAGQPKPATVAEAPERDPHHHGMGCGDEDGYNMILSAGGGTHRDVRNYLNRLDPKYLGKTIVDTLLAYVDKAEQSEREVAKLRAELAEAQAKLAEHIQANEALMAANGSLAASRNEHQDNYIYQLNRAERAVQVVAGIASRCNCPWPQPGPAEWHDHQDGCAALSPAAPTPSAPDEPLTRAELVKALRVAADGSDAGLSNFAYQLRLALREGGERE